MKLLFDLLPVILFFVTYRLASADPQGAAAWADGWLAPLVSDGPVPAQQAPIVLATAVAIVATATQIGWLLARKRRVDPALWLGLAVILLFGGATIWLHDETFIKWKPTILYWLFAAILVGGRLLFGRNLLRALLGTQLAVELPVWERLLWAWVVFFLAAGALNLWVAFTFATEVWVNFKLFGLLGLTLAFALAVGLWVARHVKERPHG
ncbi:MAG: septation protein A [Sutterellaceae bacterium]|nr:septation protein A [Burkholderiaceae bacterium]MCX7901313.1 septation protein A [Burkholderiaceae bacterium]MDW8429491.1 septation protein A [Sutterellaceae bacterium]